MTEQAIHRETTEAGGLPGRSAVSDWAQEVTALAKRWFIELGQEKLNLVFSVAQPAIWLVFFGVGIGRAVDKNVIGTSDYTGFTLPGIVAFTVIGSGVPAAMPLMWDKESGYLDKLMSMPISRSSIIVSRFVFQAILCAAQVFGIGDRRDHRRSSLRSRACRDPRHPRDCNLAFARGDSVVLSALAYWVPGHGTFFAISGFMTMPLLFISNAFVPLEAFPVDGDCRPAQPPHLRDRGDARACDRGVGCRHSRFARCAPRGRVSVPRIGAQQFNKQTGDRVN